MNQKEKSNISDILSSGRWILPIALWVILSFFSYEFIIKVEAKSLFIFDTFWLKDFLLKPSGILSCFSLFLTQFLHIPWLGSMIWVLLLTASAELTRIVYRIPSSLSFLSYIPAALFTAYGMSIGYAVYLIQLPGFFFMPVLGYLWALLTVTVIRKADKPASAAALMIIWGFAGYYIAGFYSLAGIIAALTEVLLSGRSRSFRACSLAGAVIPLLLAPIAFAGTTTYNLLLGWTIGMPEENYGLSFTAMQLPLIIAMTFPVIAPAIKYLNSISGRAVTLIIQSIALAAVIAVPASLWYRDDNFKAELGMIRATDNNEWDNVADIFEKVQTRHEQDPYWQPTRIMVLLKDLALIETGKEGERSYAFDNGSSKQNCDFVISSSIQIGKLLYMYYGIPGICNRWCSEEAELYGFNYLTYKYQAMVAILFDDTEAAKSYLGRLERTIFYRKWAKRQLELCGNMQLVAQTAPYDKIIPLMCYEDRISSDVEGCENFLLNHFNGPLPGNTTPLYDRVALFFALDSKLSELFWPRFFRYLESNNPSKLARYYQEAAYLFCNLDDNGLMERLPFDEKTETMYKTFMQRATKVGMKSLEGARKAIPVYLRHTYYFYFYYVNELELY